MAADRGRTHYAAHSGKKYRIPEKDARTQTQRLAAYVVHPNTPGGQVIRLNTDQTFTLYLHPVVDEYPALRPSGKIRIKLSRGVAKGKVCLFIDLRGLETHTTKRADES